MKTYNVHLNNVAATVNQQGFDVLVKARELVAFSGGAFATVTYLKNIGVGASVEVRTDGWIRSCMNKPALWDDIIADHYAYEAKQARRVGMIG